MLRHYSISAITGAIGAAFIAFGSLCSSASAQEAQPKPQETPQLAQPKIVALPRSLQGTNPIELMKKDANINSAATAIKKSLVERKLEVADLEGSLGNYEQLRAQMTNLSADANAMISAAVDADVYVEFTIELVKAGPAKKAKIILNIKESATAKQLGSVEGVSEPLVTEDVSSLCAMAVDNCIERGLAQVRSYWLDVPKYGKPVMLIVNTVKKVNEELPNGKIIDETLEDFVKKNSKSYRISQTSDNTIVYSPIYLDYIKYDSPTMFGRELRRLFTKDLGMKINLQNTGKSIRIQE